MTSQVSSVYLLYVFKFAFIQRYKTVYSMSYTVSRSVCFFIQIHISIFVLGFGLGLEKLSSASVSVSWSWPRPRSRSASLPMQRCDCLDT